jgi:hypothetical protein
MNDSIYRLLYCLSNSLKSLANSIEKLSIQSENNNIYFQNSKFTICETFVGCGGSFYGFAHEYFETVFVNDICDNALATLKNNNNLSNNKILCNDIRDLNIDILMRKYSINQYELDVLMGGVVCKVFSLAGLRNPYDNRNYLYLEQLRLVEGFIYPFILGHPPGSKQELGQQEANRK